MVVLADACQQRRTTAARLAATLTSMSRLRHRALLLEILGEVASGAYSVLERRYLRDVERAHGLPGVDFSGPRRAVAGVPIATSSTPIGSRSWSSTADWATRGPRTGGPTWTATSRLPRTH